MVKSPLRYFLPVYGVLVVIAIIVVALSACATVTPTDQAKIDQGAAIACAGMEAADTIFNAYVVKHPEKSDQAKIEATVYAGVHVVCMPPYTVDLPTLIKKATDAAVKISALMAT